MNKEKKLMDTISEEKLQNIVSVMNESVDDLYSIIVISERLGLPQLCLTRLKAINATLMWAKSVVVDNDYTIDLKAVL